MQGKIMIVEMVMIMKVKMRMALLQTYGGYPVFSGLATST